MVCVTVVPTYQPAVHPHPYIKAFCKSLVFCATIYTARAMLFTLLAAALISHVGAISPVIGCEKLAGISMGPNTTLLSAAPAGGGGSPLYCLAKVLVLPAINIWGGF